MKINKKLLMDDFNKKSYTEKREYLLWMLRWLAWVNKVVDSLWEMVYSLTEESEDWLYLKVYDVLLDAVLDVENNNKQKAVDKLAEIQDLLSEAKKQEEEEKLQENKEIEWMFNDL